MDGIVVRLAENSYVVAERLGVDATRVKSEAQELINRTFRLDEANRAAAAAGQYPRGGAFAPVGVEMPPGFMEGPPLALRERAWLRLTPEQRVQFLTEQVYEQMAALGKAEREAFAEAGSLRVLVEDLQVEVGPPAFEIREVPELPYGPGPIGAAKAQEIARGLRGVAGPAVGGIVPSPFRPPGTGPAARRTAAKVSEAIRAGQWMKLGGVLHIW